MIRSKLKLLIAQHEIKTGERLTYEVLEARVGLSKNALSRLATGKTDRIEFATLDKLCRYFECTLGDLLEYVPDEKAVKSKKK
ncbi:MAG: helix-turn-helix domain-containing protein [Chloroflexi bacterium]|nr:helix-turn-helix domain-containing protein [Chloroflexota bacterium]